VATKHQIRSNRQKVPKSTSPQIQKSEEIPPQNVHLPRLASGPVPEVIKNPNNTPPKPPTPPILPQDYNIILQNKANSKNTESTTTSFTKRIYTKYPPLSAAKKQTQSNPTCRDKAKLEDQSSGIQHRESWNEVESPTCRANIRPNLPHPRPYTHVPTRHLRKTNPISKSLKPPQPLSQQRITNKNHPNPTRKNKPNQTQSRDTQYAIRHPTSNIRHTK